MRMRHLLTVLYVPAAIAAFGCSDPVAPPKKGAAKLFVGTAPDSGGVACKPTSGTQGTLVKNSSSSSAITRNLGADGESGFTVTCSVRKTGTDAATGASKYAVDGSLSKDKASITVIGTAIAPKNGVDGGGEADIFIYLPDLVHTYGSPADTRCALEVHEVASGRVWATFNCPRLVDPSDTNSLCAATSSNDRNQFAFADCDD